jgi:hypothetical protein
MAAESKRGNDVLSLWALDSGNPSEEDSLHFVELFPEDGLSGGSGV